MDLVELRPLSPFVGSYKCALSEADTINDVLIERDGVVVKGKEPRKQYFGRVPVERAMTPDENRLWKEGKLPERFEVNATGTVVIEHPSPATVTVPADVAEGLIARGLAEAVGTVSAVEAEASAQPLGMRISPRMRV